MIGEKNTKKTASEMTYRPIVSSGALNSTPTNQPTMTLGRGLTALYTAYEPAADVK